MILKVVDILNTYRQMLDDNETKNAPSLQVYKTCRLGAIKKEWYVSLVSSQTLIC